MKNLKKRNKIKRIFPLNKEDNSNYFFGYYGKSPWSKDEKNILGTKVPFLDRHPSIKDKAEIIIKNIQTGKIKKIAESGSWSWQQGCMLQWIGPDFNSKIIFNDFDIKNKKFISRIININTKKERKIDFPVYAVLPDGKKALSLNFSRLDDLRKGYGYPGKEDENKNKKVPEKEGVYLLDLEKNKSKLIVSLKDLYNYKYVNSMEKGKHWVDHIEISPDGKRACFFHRWEIGEGLFHTRLFSCNIEGKNLFMFPDSGFYSHITWKNNKELFGFASLSEKFGNIRSGGKNKKSRDLLKKMISLYRKITPRFIKKRILPIGYFILKDKTRKSMKLNKVNNEDGHGTWFNDRYLITDTYPDKKHYRRLIFYDLKKNKGKTIGKFYALPDKKYIKKENLNNYDAGGLRCDLHPRWDREGKKICFDSVHEGFRGIYEICLR